jgi:inorganic pyrophosphatase
MYSVQADGQVMVDYYKVFDAIAGYGLGGSSMALFGRVGGGIYTKCADVGSDLVGKVVAGLEEDSPMNPGVIADNVGDNVGDVAGMGSDLFGSFAESSCAVLVVTSTSPTLICESFTLPSGYEAMNIDYTDATFCPDGMTGGFYFPLLISAFGILVCMVCSVLATHVVEIDELPTGVERTLKIQLLSTTLLNTIVLFLLSYWVLPDSFDFYGFDADTEMNLWSNGPIMTGVKYWYAFICAALGLWSGLIIGYFTEYMTSNTYAPVQKLSQSCTTGAAPNIIGGLALGFYSVIVPILCIAITIYFAFSLADMYGIGLSALGMLSTMSIGLTIDGYGPIADNAGGIAELCELDPEVRRRTDILDAAGNTTAAIGKGFAIGSACLVALALFGAFVTSSGMVDVNILAPLDFSALIIGAMLPYAFTAMTLNAVGNSAQEMIIEIKRQFEELNLLSGEGEPDHQKCIQIATDASLKEMIAPGILVLGSPLFMGFVFGAQAVSGLLTGGIVSGIQLAIAFSNAGGAWDNAKKFIEQGKLVVNGEVRGKRTDEHHAAVVGDTVGDPLKDTSGPSINILMKLMAITSVVFARAFNSYSISNFVNLTSV